MALALPATESPRILETPGSFVGSLGCKSSSCHGGAGPKRSQYLTWTQKDYHTKAAVILLNARSDRIAESLGMTAAGAPNPAATNSRCTICHSPFQSLPSHRLSSTARSDEGVSCESCHGAAGGWLRGHTRKDWTYNTRVGAGMRDLRSLYVRATACAACHQYLEPALLKAGHPDLFFELDGQSVAEPKHWPDDDAWSGPREWLTGQAVALREMSWNLAADPLTDEWSVARWNGLAWLCSTATSSAAMPSPILAPPNSPTRSDFANTQTQADALARRAATSNWTEDSVRNLLTALASLDSEFSANAAAAPVAGQRAKRLVLALDRLSCALNKNRGFKLKIEPEMKQLWQDVRILDSFDAAAFASHLKALRNTLDKSG